MISWHFLGRPVLSDVLFLLPDASYGALPTPSPELDQASLAHDLFGNHGRHAWEALRPAYPVSAGTKRSHDYDYGVEEFFTDMKKRRLTPSYDPRKLFHAIATHVVVELSWQI